MKDIRLNALVRFGMSVTFHATGHPAVLSTHPTTIEVTREAYLSTKGDCIVAVNASIGPSDLPQELKHTLSSAGARVKVTLKVGVLQFVVEGEGDPKLTLSHPTEFVIRKSGFTSNRTLMIHSDKSARDLPREMVELLKDPSRKITIEILAKTQV